MDRAYSQDYLTLLQELDPGYGDCLKGFVEAFAGCNGENLRGMVLFGGLVRDRAAVAGWSDIDLAVVYRDIARRNWMENAALKRRFERAYGIRIDLNEIDAAELGTDFLSIRYNSELTNALAFRERVSLSIFREAPGYQPDPDQERAAAAYYINDTLQRYRKYLNEQDLAGPDSPRLLPRVVRWLFSIVRAALRLEQIYVHPYEESLVHLRRCYPTLDIRVLEALAAGRRDGSLNAMDPGRVPETMAQIDAFLTQFTRLLNGRWRYEADR